MYVKFNALGPKLAETMQHEKKAVFWVVANPIAGRKDKKPFLEKLIASLENKGVSVKLHWTEHKGHGKLLSKQAKQAGVELLIVVGGDGSFNEVASELVGSETAVTVCPFGSGNGWYQNFARRFRYDPWLEKISARHYQKVDVGSLNGHYFFNVASLGFVASVAAEFQKLSKRGFFSYVKHIFFCFRLLELKTYQGGENLFQIPKAGFFQFLKPDNKKPYALMEAESIYRFRMHEAKETETPKVEQQAQASKKANPAGISPETPTHSSFEQALEKGLEEPGQETAAGAETREGAATYPGEPEYKAIPFYAHNLDFFLGKTYGGFLTVNRDKSLSSGSIRVMISHLSGDFFRPPLPKNRKNGLKQAVLKGLAAIFLGLRYSFGILKNNLFIIEEDVAEAEFFVLPARLVNLSSAVGAPGATSEAQKTSKTSVIKKADAKNRTEDRENSADAPSPAALEMQGKLAKTLIQVDGEEHWISEQKIVLKLHPQVLKVPH